jgi:hypothetical protein
MLYSLACRNLYAVSALSFSLCALGCVGGDDAPADPYASGAAGHKSSTKDAGDDGDALEHFDAGATDSRFPLAAGARWTYRHTSLTKDSWDEIATMRDTTYEDKPAFILEDEEDAEGAQTRSTLVVQGTGVYRAYREVHVSGALALQVKYDPAFLRYDEAWLKVGETMTLDDDWTQTCIMTSVASKCAPGAVQTGKTTHKYTVVDTHVDISVPAGKFDAIEIERFNPDASETRRFWFAPGVGKVREEDVESGAVEELADFLVPS